MSPNPEPAEPTGAAIRQWRRRFFGILAFGGIFLAVSAFAFFRAVSSGDAPARTAEQIRRDGRQEGRILFGNLERKKSHFPDKETFVRQMLRDRSEFPGVPDDLYRLFIESAWAAYTEAAEHYNRVDF